MTEFYVIESDTSTGHERRLSNMKHSLWRETFTQEEADSVIEWRRQNISRKYTYRKELAE